MIGLSLFAFVRASGAVVCVDYANHLRPVVDDRTSHEAIWAVAWEQGIVYFAHWHELQLLDFTDPASPVWLGQVSFADGRPENVSVVAGRAYIARSGSSGGNPGLSIVDVSDPLNPVLLGELTTGEPWTGVPVYDVAVVGEYAYLAGGPGGLHTVDVSDPTAPVIVDSQPAGGDARGITALAGRLWVAAGRSLRVYDISVQPSAPVHVSNAVGLGVGWDYLDVESDGDPSRLVAAGYKDASGNYDELRISLCDVTDPTAPLELGRVSEGPGLPEHLAVRGDEAYLAYSIPSGGSSLRHAGLQVIDIATPDAPQTIGFYAVSYGLAQGVAASETGAILVEGGSQPMGGYQLFDSSRPAGPPASGAHPGLARDLAVHGNELYVITDTRMDVLDATHADFPLVGSLSFPWPRVRSIEFVGDTALVGAYEPYEIGGALHAVAVDDPANPTLLATSPLPAGVTDMVVRENLAYLALSSAYCTYGYGCEYVDEMNVIDVSDPTTPVTLASVLTRERRIEVCGSWAYTIAGWSKLRAWDVSDPAAPSLVSEQTIHSSGDLVAREGALFISASSADPGFVTSVLAYSLADPANPQLVGHASLPGEEAGTLALSGDFVYASNGYGGVGVVDVSDLTHPFLVGVYNPGPRVREVAVGDGYVFTGHDHFNGWTGEDRVTRAAGHCVPATDFAPPAVASSLDEISVRPNPFTSSSSVSFALPDRGPVNIAVYDVGGRRVRVLVSETRAAGPHTVTWDGRDDSGAVLGSGVYFLKLERNSGVTTRKLVRLR